MFLTIESNRLFKLAFRQSKNVVDIEDVKNFIEETDFMYEYIFEDEPLIINDISFENNGLISQITPVSSISLLNDDNEIVEEFNEEADELISNCIPNYNPKFKKIIDQFGTGSTFILSANHKGFDITYKLPEYVTEDNFDINNVFGPQLWMYVESSFEDISAKVIDILNDKLELDPDYEIPVKAVYYIPKTAQVKLLSKLGLVDDVSPEVAEFIEKYIKDIDNVDESNPNFLADCPDSLTEEFRECIESFCDDFDLDAYKQFEEYMLPEEDSNDGSGTMEFFLYNAESKEFYKLEQCNDFVSAELIELE